MSLYAFWSVSTSYWHAKEFANIANRKGSSFFPGKDSNYLTIKTTRIKVTQSSSVLLHIELKLHSFKIEFKSADNVTEQQSKYSCSSWQHLFLSILLLFLLLLFLSLFSSALHFFLLILLPTDHFNSMLYSSYWTSLNVCLTEQKCIRGTYWLLNIALNKLLKMFQKSVVHLQTRWRLSTHAVTIYKKQASPAGQRISIFGSAYGQCCCLHIDFPHLWRCIILLSCPYPEGLLSLHYNRFWWKVKDF